jgi:gag-polypeptide of LTR copia-type
MDSKAIPILTEATELAAYKKAAAEAYLQIVQTLASNQLQHVYDAANACDAWAALAWIYSSASKNCTCLLFKHLCLLKMEEGADLTTHLNDVSTIVSNLKSTGESIPDSLVISSLLNSLPPSYDLIVGLLEDVDNITPAMLRVKLMVHDIKAQSKDKSHHGEALLAWQPHSNSSGPSTQAAPGRQCYNCLKMGHMSGNLLCPQFGEHTKLGLYNCGKGRGGGRGGGHRGAQGGDHGHWQPTVANAATDQTSAMGVHHSPSFAYCTIADDYEDTKDPAEALRASAAGVPLTRTSPPFDQMALTR